MSRKKSKKKAMISKENATSIVIKQPKLIYNKFIVSLCIFVLNSLSWIIWAFHFYFYAPKNLRDTVGERTLSFSVLNLIELLQHFRFYRRENGVFVGIARIFHGIQASWFLYSFCLIVLFIFYDYILKVNKKTNLIISSISLVVVGIITVFQFNVTAGFRDIPLLPLIWGTIVCCYGALTIMVTEVHYSIKLHSPIPLTKGIVLIDLLLSMPISVFLIQMAYLPVFLVGAPAGSYISIILSSIISIVACVLCWWLIRNARRVYD